MAIQLDELSSIPKDIQELLARYESQFRGTEFLDELMGIQGIVEAVESLNAYAVGHGLVAYHYSRLVVGDLLDSGLCLPCFDKRHDAFIKQHGGMFTEEQRMRLRTRWSEHFDKRQLSVRESRIWFNLTRSSVHLGKADSLFTYYGGESIYFPMHLRTDDKDIGLLLEQIGTPVTIMCAIDVHDIKSKWHDGLIFGKVLASCFHKTVNSNAHEYDTDLYVESDVLPERILKVCEMTRKPTGRWDFAQTVHELGKFGSRG